jgi:hypothetical protein
MMCRYCHRGCLIVPNQKVEKIVRWKCYNCDSLFKYLEDGGLICIHWRMLYIKGHSYFVKLYDGVTGNAPEFVISSTAMDDWGEIYWREIIRWDFIPDWTPHNAEANLAKVLPFL